MERNSKPNEEFAVSVASVASSLEQRWKSDPRWAGIKRPYGAADVERLRGTVHIEYTLARLGAERLWRVRPTRARWLRASLPLRLVLEEMSPHSLRTGIWAETKAALEGDRG